MKVQDGAERKEVKRAQIEAGGVFVTRQKKETNEPLLGAQKINDEIIDLVALGSHFISTFPASGHSMIQNHPVNFFLNCIITLLFLGGGGVGCLMKPAAFKKFENLRLKVVIIHVF